MERESARVVRGHKASKADLAAGIEDTLRTHRATGFVGIRYRHRVNRLQDPHLHTHMVVGNWAQGPDGRFTALAGEHIYEQAKAGGAVYQLALRSRARELEPWIEWGEVENGLARRLGGAGPRRAAGGAVQAASRDPRSGGRARGPGDARRPRAARRDVAPDPQPQGHERRSRQTWNDEIVTCSSEWLTPADVAAYREVPAFENTESFPVESVQARAFGPNGVTANQNTFERKDVVIEVANAAPQGIGPWLADIDAVVDAVMDSDQVVDVRTEKLREKKTTVELLEHEQRIIEVAVEGLADGRAILDADTIERGLENFYAGGAGVESLNEDQLGVLHAVAADGNAISSIEALAGSGRPRPRVRCARCSRRAGIARLPPGRPAARCASWPAPGLSARAPCLLGR